MSLLLPMICYAVLLLENLTNPEQSILSAVNLPLMFINWRRVHCIVISHLHLHSISNPNQCTQHRSLHHLMYVTFFALILTCVNLTSSHFLTYFPLCVASQMLTRLLVVCVLAAGLGRAAQDKCPGGCRCGPDERGREKVACHNGGMTDSSIFNNIDFRTKVSFEYRYT